MGKEERMEKPQMGTERDGNKEDGNNICLKEDGKETRERKERDQMNGRPGRFSSRSGSSGAERPLLRKLPYRNYKNLQFSPKSAL